jgi:hypothetical protein
MTFESEDGEKRAYFTRVNSVISYFTEDDDGGVAVHVMPGEFACPWSTTADKLQSVRMAMLAETARRLQCRIDQVQSHSLEDIRKICDPHLKHHYHWAGRGKGRVRPDR